MLLSKKTAIILTVSLLLPPAYATQEHSDPEGLYSHMLAHMFFFLSMVVLVIQIKMTTPLARGWKYIGVAAFLFILWNLDTLTVHWLRESIGQELFRGSAQQWGQKLVLANFKGKGYYAGKILDHFLSVGAVSAFILGVRSFREEVE